MTRRIRAALDGQPVDDGLDGHHVSLELELGALEACGHTDQLREMEDGHLEVAAGLLQELRLPGVEREMAERARRDHRVSSCLLCLLDRLDELRERDVLACLDDRKPAALDLGGIVDRLAAARLDDPL